MGLYRRAGEGSGLRTQKKVTDHGETATTDYIYHGKKLVELTCGEDTLHFFYDAQDRPVKLEHDGETYTYISDLYGNITGLLDAVGNLVVEYRYDTWGRLLRISGIQASRIGQENVFRYRGYAFDDETGLFYLRNRYYIPNRNRFLNADHRAGRRGDVLTHNLFAYCDNRPIICLDQSGAGKTYVFYYYFPESKSPLKEEAMNSPYFDSSDTENVEMIAVETSEDFINAWNAMEGEIDDVYLYLHGGAGHLQLARDTIGIGDEFDYQLEELDEKSISGAVYDFACHSAENYNGTSVAEVLSKKTKTTVIACDVGVSYRFGNFFLRIFRGNTWHARTETAHMYSDHWYKFTYNEGQVIKTVINGIWRFKKN